MVGCLFCSGEDKGIMMGQERKNIAIYSVNIQLISILCQELV